MSVLVQVTAVQNWSITKIAEKVSRDVGTQVSIGHIKLDFFNDLVADHLLILDEENDTLLYSKRAYFDLDKPLRALHSNTLVFQEIRLEESKCYLKTNRVGRTNYQFLLDYLSKGQEEAQKIEALDSSARRQQEKLLLVFSPTQIDVSDIRFEHRNEQQGKYTSLFLPSAVAELERISVDDPLHFTKVVVEEPKLRLEKFVASSEGEDEQAPSLATIPVGSISDYTNYQEKKPFWLIVDELEIEQGYAQVVDQVRPRKETFSNVIDFADASAHSIHIHIKDLIWEGDHGSLAVDLLELGTKEGFSIQKFNCEEVAIDQKQILLNNYELVTPNSRLTNRFSLSYRDFNDFKDFENSVVLNANFRDSHLALRDILYFVNKLNNNEFFQLNGGERIDLTGRLRGLINNLRGERFLLEIADKGRLAGTFNLKNITSLGHEHVSLSLNTAEVDITTLRQLIPRFNPPANYDKLGLLQFSGQFEGAFSDFVASGDLVTNLGNLKSDLRIAIPDSGISEASYQGNLELIDFDLASWTGSDKYGLASFSAAVKNGKNLDLDNAFANLFASLDHFHFNGYDYKHMILKGELNRSFFDGQLYSADPNLDLDFNGSIDYRDSIPHFDFKASVDHIDLRALNISKKDLSASGDINFNFSLQDIYHIDGFAQGYNLQIEDGPNYYNLDTATILSLLDEQGQRILSVASDILDFDLRGTFELETMPHTFNTLASAKHPEFSKKFNLNFQTDSLHELSSENDFIFDVVLKDSRGLQRILDATLADFSQISMNGYVKNSADKDFTYRIQADAPIIEFKNYKVEDLQVDLDGRNEQSLWDISATKIWKGTRSIAPLHIQGNLVSDSLNFSLQADDVADVFSHVDITGLFYLNEGFYQINLANSAFELLDEPWQIVPDNYIQVGDHYLKTKNMVFLSDDSYIRLSSPGDNSLALELEKIDISFLDDLFQKKQLAFQGDAYTTLKLANLFKPSELTYQLSLDSLLINGDHYGDLAIQAQMDSITSKGNVNLSILHPDQSLEIDGDFFVPNKQRNIHQDKSLYRLDLQVSKYPIALSEYFIGHSISESTGTFDAQITLHDNSGKPALDGTVVLDGSTKLDYLGTTYRMERQPILISSSMFDFTGTHFIDELGNQAQFTGGITHDHLKDLALDVVIYSDYFMFLNTTKEDNDLYYGQGIGEGEVEIGGNFQAGNIRVKATTGPGSKINIPVNYDYSTGEHFIKYVFHEDSLAYKDAAAELRGTNLDMQLNITPDADMQIIFDEFSGDIIKGTGNGNLTMTKERGGNFQINGKYDIEQGQYLYTLLDFINKPFTIDRGGVITWTGDPLDADLNIKAKYTGLKVPPRNLIADYLEGRNNSQEAELADISTQVDLVLGLQGILSQPQIDFDIQFPDIDPSIRNLTDSKMRVLKEDVSELNRQVYGLLFFNSFLPPSINLDLTATTVNTLSEFLTSQLSNYVAAYITEGVEEVDYISGVDFYFDYNFYRSEDFVQGTQTGVKTGSEFALAPNIRFFDDRLAFSPGASVIEGTVLQGSTFIGTDVKLDFFVTDDKRLKLSLFYKRFPSLSGGRNKLGLGFRFYNQYDSLGDIFRKNKGNKNQDELPVDDLETSVDLRKGQEQ